MLLKALASIILCFSFIFGSFPGFGLPEVPKKVDLVSASYDGYVITLADGVLLDLRVAGPNVVFTSSEDRNYNITLVDIEDNRIIRNFSEGGESFAVEMASYMSEDTLYYIIISYDAFDFEFMNGNNVIFKKGNNVCFWKNSTYEYNLGSTSEMWTDEQSLRECLQPQNDVECDDPVLIGYSEQICSGASSDWEKVFRIYRYIAGEMAYDNEEANADAAGYQDSAVTVLRDGKGICEGFANVFTALCRAQGIPAVVEFGMGYANYEEMTTRVPTTDELADHAWAAVYLGDRWQFVDPTFDMSRFYNSEGDIDVRDFTTYYYLLPLEAFSNDHLIMDADTIHSVPSAGHCGNYADYEITRDGVLHIYGSGSMKMPDWVNGYSKVVFEPGCEITELEDNCFCDCDLITVVILPDTVKRIDNYAFATCEDLEYVYLPEGLEYIGVAAFDGCDELSYLRVPDSIKEIDDWAFDDDPRLYLSIPSSMRNNFASNYYAIKPLYVEYR